MLEISMPEVSIIVPVYKVEPYLHRCVDSILAQTFSDFELILVDDGSPDNCPAICDEYAEKDDRIHVIHQENGGLSAARNAGMAAARGKYYLFCDSDDYVSPYWCEAMYSASVEHHDSFVFCRINSVDEANPHVVTNTINLEKKEYEKSAFIDMHICDAAGYVWSALFDAAIIQRFSISFRMDVIIEDLPFCIEYLKHVTSLFYCGDAEYYYVQRNAQTLSRKYHQDGFRKYKEKYAIIQDYIIDCVAADRRCEYQIKVANAYMYLFLNSLKNTFDERSTLTFFQKLKYNQQAIQTHEFKSCLQNYTAGKENVRYLKLLQHGNYYAAYLYTLGAKTKGKLFRR